MEKNTLNLDNFSAYLKGEGFSTGGLIDVEILNIKSYEILFLILYFFLFLLIYKYLLKQFKIDKFKSNFIIAYHLMFVMIAYIYSITNVNDHDSFFQSSYYFPDFDDGYISNIFMHKVYYFLIFYLNLSYFSIFIFFGFLSSIGFVVLFNIFIGLGKKYEINENIIFYLFLFPTWHFFTSFPGKDSLFVLSLSLIFYFLKKNKTIYLLIPLIIIFFIRPHMSVIVTLTVFATYFINNFFEKSFKKFNFVKIFIILLTSLFFINFIIGSDSYSSYVYDFAIRGENMRGYGDNFSGWYSTIANNRLEIMSKYLYKPLFNFSGASNILLSIENIILLCILIYAIIHFRYFLTKRIMFTNEFIFSIVLFFLGLYVLSNFTANIGISSRQKWMILPCFFIFILPSFKALKNYIKIK